MTEKDKVAVFWTIGVFVGSIYMAYHVGNPIGGAFWFYVGIFSAGIVFGLKSSAPQVYALRVVLISCVIPIALFMYAKRTDPYAAAMPGDFNDRMMPWMISIPILTFAGIFIGSLFNRSAPKANDNKPPNGSDRQ